MRESTNIYNKLKYIKQIFYSNLNTKKIVFKNHNKNF